ncbi:MAG: Actin-like protein arp9 (SWI/SNF complex component arp9) [Bogoriella megaspora]|nr:MAG: Actin-like protein arp9 (SWI/SNF complex component arp9) [Bogoriella megaspora]
MGFKDDQIIVIAPGSKVTLAQLGLPESFTPARVRVHSRMFAAEEEGQWEPYKIRVKGRQQNQATGSGTEADGEDVAVEESLILEEDVLSEDGAVWPLKGGRIVDWSCFYGLMNHVYNSLNPPFHTPILLIAEPVWTPKDHEKITQFFFEKFKIPAFALIDSAIASCYAFGSQNATVVDIGQEKADITAISDFVPHDRGRAIALPNCGGEAMTQTLLKLLGPRGFKREMCEQLKRSPICEILPPGTSLPGGLDSGKEAVSNPAAAASTGATGSGPGHRNTAAALGSAPIGPGPNTEVGEEPRDEEDNEGVLDVASIVAGGKMSEYLARKEKEKADKAASKKKGSDATTQQAKAGRLPNSRRERTSFMYEDHALLDALKNQNLSGEKIAEAQAALDEGSHREHQTSEGISSADSDATGARKPVKGIIRREIEVGIERFQAASDGLLERIADAVYRTIISVEEVNKRSELWDSMIFVGNGSKVRGFKEALLATLTSKYMISPSSATIFTSEIPSNISTPTGTGANTPQPQMQPPHAGSHVNPLLLAATTAQVPHLNPPTALSQHQSHNTHSSHGQTPTSIKTVKIPEYFPEWKEYGYEEAAFLGAQVAARVLFVVDQGNNKGFMNRTDYNDQGPSGIHDYSL